jgi:hypothetical protein
MTRKGIKKEEAEGASPVEARARYELSSASPSPSSHHPVEPRQRRTLSVAGSLACAFLAEVKRTDDTTNQQLANE